MTLTLMHSLTDLIQTIKTSHVWEAAHAGADEELNAFEKRAGFAVPGDLRAFYLQIHRANIAGWYQVLPVALLQRTGCALRGDEWEDSEPPSWYVFCDVYNGNFVGIELEQSADGHNRILDCDHDNTSERGVVATSFTEFLGRAISAKEHLYYLHTGPISVIEVPCRPPQAYLRREYQRWSKDPEVGPSTCKKIGCGRLAVSLSVHCRRHHFEAIQRLPYPFDD